MARLIARTCARLAALAGASLLASMPGAAKEQLVDAIAAQVGTRIVLISEVMRIVGPQESAMRAAGAPEGEIAKLRADGLERMIESKLIEEMVGRLELYASDEEIDRTIESIARENGLSMEQLQASVVFHGMTIDQYREQIKRDLERRNVVNAMIGSKIEVDEAEVKQLYQQRFANQPEGGEMIHVRQLLVTYGGLSKRTKQAACGSVADARTRIAGGEDFAVVARELSDVAPQDGGDIGWLHLDAVAPWMSNALAPLQPGDTSDPIELPFGCSILNLVERRDFRPVAYEDAREALTQELWERSMENGYREWMEELRSQTYIDRRGYFADAARFGDVMPVEPAGEPGLP
jgi:peptidyl-prolyl cis-trans isomerase SurA